MANKRQSIDLASNDTLNRIFIALGQGQSYFQVGKTFNYHPEVIKRRWMRLTSEERMICRNVRKRCCVILSRCILDPVRKKSSGCCLMKEISLITAKLKKRSHSAPEITGFMRVSTAESSLQRPKLQSSRAV